MASKTGVGLSVQEYYYYARGMQDLTPETRNVWTPNYSGGHVVIPEWFPLGAFSIEFELYSVDRSINQFILDSTSSASWDVLLSISNENIDPRNSGAISTPLIDGRASYIFNSAGLTPATIDGIAFIGRHLGNPLEFLRGQLRNLRLTDLDNPSNSRYYPSVIRSETMPDTTVLVDELGGVDVIVSDSSDWSNISGLTVINNIYSIRGSSAADRELRINTPIDDNGVYRVSGVIERVGTSGLPRVIVYGVGARDGGIQLTDDNFTVYLSASQQIDNFGLDNALVIFFGRNLEFNLDISSIRIERLRNGTLTNFPAAQPWVPVLGTGQAYLSDFNLEAGAWINGVSTANNLLTSFSSSASGFTEGSWGTAPPEIGSLIKSGGVVVQVTDNTDLSGHNVNYAIATGTPAEIQAAFQYPNVFDIDAFDSGTEAYNGNFNTVSDSPEGFNLGVDSINNFITFSGNTTGNLVSINGSYTNRTLPSGSIVTAENGASLQVTLSINNIIQCDRISGTDEQIQTGFQWPNHFTVTPP